MKKKKSWETLLWVAVQNNGSSKQQQFKTTAVKIAFGIICKF
jgi:hypothetical protein